MRERKYIKFRVDMYDDTKFKIIDRMPERDLIHYVWSRIVILAGKVNLCGELYFSKTTPYKMETLAIEFNRDVDQIKLALDVFIELEMVELTGDNAYKVKNFAKHQNIKVKENTETIKKVNETEKSQQIIETACHKEEINFQDNIDRNNKISETDDLKNDNKISLDEDNNCDIKINIETVNKNEIGDDFNVNKKKGENIKADDIEFKDENMDEDENIFTFTEGDYVIPKDYKIIKSWTFNDNDYMVEVKDNLV